MKQFTKRFMLLSVIIMTGLCAMAQSFTLKGKVTDEDGNALELATVSCVEQATVTMTNLKGEFQVKLQSADSVVVKFSMIGYTKMDLGIAKYHFEIGAGKENFIWV